MKEYRVQVLCDGRHHHTALVSAFNQRGAVEAALYWAEQDDPQANWTAVAKDYS